MNEDLQVLDEKRLQGSAGEPSTAQFLYYFTPGTYYLNLSIIDPANGGGAYTIKLKSDAEHSNEIQ